MARNPERHGAASSRFIGMQFADSVVATAHTATGQRFTSDLTKIAHVPGQAAPS